MKPSQSNNLVSSSSSPSMKKITTNSTKVRSEERANAIFSLMLLLEHRDHWNSRDAFWLDWSDNTTIKWCITSIHNQIEVISTTTDKKLLGFGSKASSLQFLESFKDLINTAKDLL